MWHRGVARVVRLFRASVVVECPHCGKEHVHSKLSLGSREVIAGCHKGYTKCYSYAIPKRRMR